MMVENNDKSETPLPDSSEFENSYFIQTRREIDTEKQERNKILNYGLLAVGALSAGLLKLKSELCPDDYIWVPLLCIPLLALVTGLVAARRMKLHQIADRWITLYRITKRKKLDTKWLPLENIVIKGFIQGRYLTEDLWVHIALSLVGYGLIVYFCRKILYPFEYWSAIIIVVIVLHFFVTTFWLRRPFLDINELKREFGNG